jgi:hypothetical protein
MIRKDLIRSCLMDACHGEPHPLMGLLDYLVYDCHISLERLVDIGERSFGLPKQAGYGAIYDLRPEMIQ